MLTRDGEGAPHPHPVHERHHTQGEGERGEGGGATTEGKTVEQNATSEKKHVRECEMAAPASRPSWRTQQKKERRGHTQEKRRSGSRHSTKRGRDTHAHTHACMHMPSQNSKRESLEQRRKTKRTVRNGPEERGHATATHANNNSNEATTHSQREGRETHARPTATAWKRQGRSVGSRRGGEVRTWEHRTRSPASDSEQQQREHRERERDTQCPMMR